MNENAVCGNTIMTPCSGRGKTGTVLRCVTNLSISHKTVALVITNLSLPRCAPGRGYILKDADEEEMMRAICAVGEGEAIFSSTIASRLMEYFATTRTLTMFPTSTANCR